MEDHLPKKSSNRAKMAALGLTEGTHAFSQANSAFTAEIYKIMANDTGNLFFSPLSIQVIISLVYFGAKGDTAKEIERGLHLPNNKQLTEDGITAVMNNLNSSAEVVLEIANRIFVRTGFKIKEGFRETAVKFLAGVEQLNFSEEEKSRKAINDWIAQKTHNKITDVILQGDLKPSTLMVLVNAIYFKGAWLNPFEEDDTSTKPFHLTSGQTKDVDMMYLQDHFRYADIPELNSQALLLPYKGWRISMLILLPREINGIHDLERKFGTLSTSEILGRMTRNDVQVHLPKFKLEYKKELKDTLEALGIVSMFDVGKVNLSGIADETIFVDRVLHKAYIDVNEKGTEAAAVTVLIGLEAAAPSFDTPPPPVEFKADHSFLFCIIDDETKTILFVGRVVSP